MTGLTVDDVLDKIGSMGRYQITLIFILSYIMGINVISQLMLLTFVAAEPPWRCTFNNTACRLKGEFKPGDDNYNIRCNLSRSDWEFSKSFTSVVTEFDLICDKAILASVSSSVIFAGWLFASLFSGVLSDKFGRKPVLFFFAFACAVFGLIGAFSKTYWFYVICRFLVGIGIGGCFMTLVVLATEFVGVRHRHVASSFLWYAWSLALMSLAGIAYLVRDWRTLSIVFAAPGFLPMFAWWFVPESARYLLLKGKVKETENVLRRIAQTNGKEYPSDPLSDPTTEGEQKMGDFRDMFRGRKMVYTTLVSWYTWFVNALVYYGVSFASPSLGGNMYFNFFLTTIIEIPGTYVGVWITGKYGRKKAIASGLIIASLASSGAVLLLMFDPGEDVGIIMAMIAKFFVEVSFTGMTVYSAELFPTVIRNIGMTSCSVFQTTGCFASPFIVNLNIVHPLLPFGIIALNAFIAGVLCMTLPETKGMPTAETMNTDRGGEGAANNIIKLNEGTHQGEGRTRDETQVDKQPADQGIINEIAEEGITDVKETDEENVDETQSSSSQTPKNQYNGHENLVKVNENVKESGIQNTRCKRNQIEHFA